jgi:hypothetical protein
MLLPQPLESGASGCGDEDSARSKAADEADS